nr:hypothetical protein TDPV-350 [Oriental turtle dovepox virus]
MIADLLIGKGAIKYASPQILKATCVCLQYAIKTEVQT